MAGHTLVVIRHGKSDWTTGHADAERPLSARGRRQAPRTGAYLAHLGITIDLAVVSPAERTRETWDLVAPSIGATAEVRYDQAVYGAWAGGLLEIVRTLPGESATAAIVGHNPGLEELVAELAGSWVPMPTSALAILELPGTWVDAGTDPVRLIASGRPAE